MYLVSILKTDRIIVEVATSSDNVLALANIFESSSTVLNYKVSGTDAVGLDQKFFGGGDYHKWVKRHY